MVRIRIGKEEQQLTLETFEARVQSGQIPPDAFVRFEAVTGPNFVRADELELYRSLRNPDIVAWRERFRRGKAPILTALLTEVLHRRTCQARYACVQVPHDQSLPTCGRMRRPVAKKKGKINASLLCVPRKIEKKS